MTISSPTPPQDVPTPPHDVPTPGPALGDDKRALSACPWWLVLGGPPTGATTRGDDKRLSQRVAACPGPGRAGAIEQAALHDLSWLLSLVAHHGWLVGGLLIGVGPSSVVSVVKPSRWPRFVGVGGA